MPDSAAPGSAGLDPDQRHQVGLMERAGTDLLVLVNDLLGKHFSIVGTTGSGKSCAVATILRSVITRCDTIIKAPSNDPLTAIAIARTLADVAPDHPITKHLVVGYWKGGDLAVEEILYQPQHVEKIVTNVPLRREMGLAAHQAVQGRDWAEAGRKFWELSEE